MLLFAFSCGEPALSEDALASAVRRAAAPFPHLDPTTLQCFRGPAGTVAGATLGHPPELVAPRRPVARRGDVVVALDGLPVEPDRRLAAYDAEVVLDCWEQSPHSFEGQFAAVRADLASGRLEALTDALGLGPLFAGRPPGGGWVVANSVEALRALAGPVSLDREGAATALSFGWVAGGRTLWQEVRPLPGGHVVTFEPRGRRDTAHFSPALAVHAARRGPLPTEAFVEQMVRLVEAGTSNPAVDVRCGVTAGRDTRVLVALLRAAGSPATYYTIGEEHDRDVEIARLLARELGLPYHIDPPQRLEEQPDWRQAPSRFVAMTDGLSSLLQLLDIGGLDKRPDHVGVRLWGVGGEIARAGSALRAVATNAPLLAPLRSTQRRLLRLKVRHAGLLDCTAVGLAGDHVDAFLGARADEGWPAPWGADVFYAFDELARSGSAGIRRASPVDDVFSPFCSRLFATYALSLRPDQRLEAAAHWRLLSALDHRLRDLPAENAWPRRGRLGSRVELLARAFSTLAGRAWRGRPAAGPVVPPRYMFRWLDRHRAELRDLCLAHESSALWELADRGAVERAFAAPAADEERAEILLRIVTLFWYVHGPAPEGA